MKFAITKIGGHALLYLAVVLCAAACEHSSSSSAYRETTLRVGEKNVNVLLADDAKTRRKDMRTRKRLNTNQGILYVYPDSLSRMYFHNNNIYGLTFDLAFIDRTKQIVDIQTLQPDRTSVLASSGGAQFALQMNEGWFQNQNIHTGDSIEVPSSVISKAEPSETFSSPQQFTINKTPLFLEIADEPSEHETGLMHRRGLQKDHGMLFQYDAPQIVKFYMKNTLIPLDIAYVKSDGTILEIHTRKPLDTTTIPSSEPVKYVIEMHKHWFRAHDIQPGDRVSGLPED